MLLRRHISSWLSWFCSRADPRASTFCSRARALRPESQLARSFVILALVLGSLYTAVNPPLAVNDERHHWLRVLEMSKGRLHSRVDERSAFYLLPRDYAALIARYAALQGKHSARVNLGDLAHDLTTPPEHPQRWARRTATASGYGPVPYLPHLPAVWLARVSELPPLSQIYLARLFSLAAYALIVAWSIAWAGELRWALFAFALMPMSLTQAAGLSADGMAIALSFALFALVRRGSFVEPLSRNERIILLVVCTLLPACKPPYMLFVGGLLTLRWQGPRARLKRWLYAALGIGLAISSVAAWSYLNRSPVSPSDGGGDSARQIAWLGENWARVPAIALDTLLELSDDYAIQFVALRDVIHRDMRFSGGLLACIYLPLLFVLALGAARERARAEPWLRWAAAWLVLLGLICAGGVFMAMFLYATPPGIQQVIGVQGRYFIPIAPALLILLSTFGSPAPGRWLQINGGVRLKWAIVVANGLVLLALLARYYGSPEIAWPY